MTSSGFRHSAHDGDLLLREMHHRSSNDLQLVVSLLGLQSRRAAIPEVRQALADAMQRVSVLTRARNAIRLAPAPSLATALQQVCEALGAHAEPRSIQISLDAGDEVHGLSEAQISVLALVVNELMTNAIKHAFQEGKSGHIRVSIGKDNRRNVVIIVDDDGLPFSEAAGDGGGLGMELVKRLMMSIGGLLIPPPAGSKVFELRMPADTSGF